MHKKLIAKFLLIMAMIISMGATGTVAYAAESEASGKEGGQSFLSILVEGAEEGTWEDVEEVTPGMIGDGIYTIEASVESVEGTAVIESPVTMHISGGSAKVLIVWDNNSYEYMKVKDVEYAPLKGEDTSAFEIPVDLLNEDLELTVGGAKEDGSIWNESYILTFDLDTVVKDGMNPRILGMALGVIIGIIGVIVVIKLDKIHDKKKAEAGKTPAVKNTNKYRK